MTTSIDLERLVDGAEQTIAGAGHDPATVLGLALLRIAETHADDERPLCPGCGKRRVVRGLQWCKPCTDQAANDKADKRAWWRANRGPGAGQADAG